MQANDLNDIWVHILQIAKQKMQAPLYALVSTAIVPMHIDNNSIHIGVLQGYIKGMIETQPLVSEPLNQAIREATGKDISVVLIDLYTDDTKSTSPSSPTYPPYHEDMDAMYDTPPVVAPPMPLPKEVQPDVSTHTIGPTAAELSPSLHVSDGDQAQTGERQADAPEPFDIDASIDAIRQNVAHIKQPKGEPIQEELYYRPKYKEPVYIDRPEEPLIPDEPMTAVNRSSNAAQPAPTLQSTDIPIDLSSSQLNESYRFDNYITGNANRIPFGAALNVSEHPGGDYNPLFIYGPSGLGKTHLMHAIGNAIVERFPHYKVMCTTSEKFMNLFIESIRKRQGELFRNTFRNIDVLLIDDIQFLENKEGTKTEFFNTFNELLDNHKQIVLTSDTMPNDMDQFEERLRSRFQAGYVATMENPDLETRIAILKALVERENKKNKNLFIDNDAINYVALQFDENIRVLQGAFTKLIGTASLEQKSNHIDMAYTKKTLSDLITTERVSFVDIPSIQDFISTYFHIKKQDLLGTKRKKDLVFARQIAMYLCRDMINESYPQIASAFSRDHTTILHAYEKISKKIESEPETKQLISDIKSKLASRS